MQRLGWRIGLVAALVWVALLAGVVWSDPLGTADDSQVLNGVTRKGAGGDEQRAPGGVAYGVESSLPSSRGRGGLRSRTIPPEAVASSVLALSRPRASGEPASNASSSTRAPSRTEARSCDSGASGRGPRRGAAGRRR